MDLKPTKKKFFDFIPYSAIIVLGILIDQITKLIAVKFLKGSPSVPLIKGVLQWTYVENRGAAFGMMKESRWVFMVISTVAITLMLAYLLLAANQNKLFKISLAMLISGGIGNMIDRVALGYVVDFIDFCLIDFAVFNFADSIVCIGAGLLILSMVLDIIKEEKEKKKTGQEK